MNTRKARKNRPMQPCAVDPQLHAEIARRVEAENAAAAVPSSSAAAPAADVLSDGCSSGADSAAMAELRAEVRRLEGRIADAERRRAADERRHAAQLRPSLSAAEGRRCAEGGWDARFRPGGPSGYGPGRARAAQSDCVRPLPISGGGGGGGGGGDE